MPSSIGFWENKIKCVDNSACHTISTISMLLIITLPFFSSALSPLSLSLHSRVIGRKKQNIVLLVKEWIRRLEISGKEQASIVSFQCQTFCVQLCFFVVKS